MLNVHIPTGEPLLAEAVEESFELARAFFRGISPVFICHSWLLDSDLSDILNPESNIIQFQSHFYIYDVDKSSKEAEQRIFSKESDNPSTYEENTQLQRHAKAYLMAGSKLGSGYGIKLNR
ncbi:hypothetical protein [Paenibacillus sp. CMAA1364]